VSDGTVLITGGGGNLGRSVVAAFEREGWRIFAPGRGEADLEDASQAARIVRECGPQLRAVAHLVGGFADGQPVEDTPVAHFEAMFRLNVRPAYLVLQAAMPVLRANGGAAVCVGSRAGQQPFAGAAGYCASKAALHALVGVVAAEGVRCNAVVPRVIDDPASVAETIVFLCEARSAAISGALIPV
jgi:NAD(P)-dependent dehydrogenase (short-subunit alcohol dehydrogenase family)